MFKIGHFGKFVQKYCKITLIFEEGNACQVMQVGGGGRAAVSDYGT